MTTAFNAIFTSPLLNDPRYLSRLDKYQQWDNCARLNNQIRFGVVLPKITIINQTNDRLKIQNGPINKQNEWIYIDSGKKQIIPMREHEVWIKNPRVRIHIDRATNRLMVDDDKEAVFTHQDGFTFTINSVNDSDDYVEILNQLEAGSATTTEPATVVSTEAEPATAVSTESEPATAVSSGPSTNVTVTRLDDSASTQVEDQIPDQWAWIPVGNPDGRVVAQRNRQTGEVNWF